MDGSFSAAIIASSASGITGAPGDITEALDRETEIPTGESEEFVEIPVGDSEGDAEVPIGEQGDINTGLVEFESDGVFAWGVGGNNLEFALEI